eukprot:2801097-Rhodomonas_salina.3
MIESRLAKLDKEKEELTQYYSLDKERRSLHHALLSQKIRGLHEDLTGIEREKSELKVDTAENDSQQQVSVRCAASEIHPCTVRRAASLMRSLFFALELLFLRPDITLSSLRHHAFFALASLCLPSSPSK